MTNTVTISISEYDELRTGKERYKKREEDLLQQIRLLEESTKDNKYVTISQSIDPWSRPSYQLHFTQASEEAQEWLEKVVKHANHLAIKKFEKEYKERFENMSVKEYKDWKSRINGED